MTERQAIDLDAVGEELVEAYDITIGGHVYEFPGVMGAKALKGFVPLLGQIENVNLEAPSAEELTTVLDVVEKILSSLVGPDQADEIMTRAPIPKLLSLLERLLQVYGVGEAPASPPSSKSGGAKSSRTSAGSTGSTSATSTPPVPSGTSST